MNILILGNANDAHAAHLYRALIQEGVTANFLDTRLFPTQIQCAWNPVQEIGYLVLPEKRRLDLQTIHSVFWRTISPSYIPSLQNPEQQKIAHNDAITALRTLIQGCPARWINSWQAYQFHKEKPLQLSKVKRLGVSIPQTLISNHPDTVIEFCRQVDQVIFKPVAGGAHTQMLMAQHLDQRRLSLALRLAPITLQEYIPGTNVRTYVIGDSIYSAEIRSPALDFRDDPEAAVIPVELSLTVQEQCQAIRQALFLEWTAIDWRLQPNGEYVFLEANPSPMFLQFEAQTGFPITQALVHLLTT